MSRGTDPALKKTVRYPGGLFCFFCLSELGFSDTGAPCAFFRGDECGRRVTFHTSEIIGTERPGPAAAKAACFRYPQVFVPGPADRILPYYRAKSVSDIVNMPENHAGYRHSALFFVSFLFIMTFFETAEKKKNFAFSIIEIRVFCLKI